MAELVANLNEDIALDILLFCDVFSILKMEQTCRYLRKVSLYRHLWLTLATNLDYDHAPNLLPHESLQSLSTARLREMVIRSTRSYLNWTRPEGPKPTCSIVFEIPLRSIRLVKLLPGGKYLVVLDYEGRFLCYDTESQKQLCSCTTEPSRGEEIKHMDCLFVGKGDALVLSYGSKQLVDMQSSVAVVRFNVHSGTTEIVRKFTFSGGDAYGPIKNVVIGCDVVVVQEGLRTLVCNWRTGEATAIVFKKQPLIHLSFILHSHLCVVQKKAGGSFSFSALPFSVIFCHRSGFASESDPYTSVQSEDVFRDSIIVEVLSLNNGITVSRLASVSICTSSWKTPSVCEHDAPATPTRILFLFRIRYNEYIASELTLSPQSTVPLNRPSLPAKSNDTQANYLLTHCRQSPVHSFRRRDMLIEQITPAARTGRLFAIYSGLDFVRATVINMLELLEETPFVETTTSIGNELVTERATLTSPMDRLLDEASDERYDIHVETYSGSMWYRDGSTLFIHRTD